MKAPEGADNTLIYILAHPSRDAAKASFGAFRKDPDWIADQGRRRSKRRVDLYREGRREVGVSQGGRLLADQVSRRRDEDRKAGIQEGTAQELKLKIRICYFSVYSCIPVLVQARPT